MPGWPAVSFLSCVGRFARSLLASSRPRALPTRPAAPRASSSVGRFGRSLPAGLLSGLLLALALFLAAQAPAAAQGLPPERLVLAGRPGAENGTTQSPTPAGEHRAGLVVRFAGGRVETRCVAFSEPSISGEGLLARSGFTAIINPTGALGGAVCSIDGAGCSYPSQDCFCKCVGVQCEYWAYYHWLGAAGSGTPDGGGWQYSQIGASAYQVTDGALEGWSWGPGNFSSGTEPPKVAFAGVCPAGAATAPAANAPAGPVNLAQYAAFALLAALLLVMALLVLRRRRVA